jgi:PAS domain S-box-containing protein
LRAALAAGDVPTRASDLAAFWEQAAELSCVVDADGRLMLLNPAWERVLGHPAGLLMGTPAVALVHPDDRPALERSGWGRPDGPETHGLDLRTRCADGSYRTLRWAGRGLATCWRGIAEDVTDHVEATRRAEQDAHFKARLLDEVDAAVIATDLDGSVIHWNAGAEQLYGRPAGAALGRSIAELGLTREHEAPVLLDTLRRTGRCEADLEGCRADGVRFPGRLRLALVRHADGEPVGIVGVSVDMSDHVQIQQELRSAHDYLRAVTDSMAEGVWVNDEDGRLTYLNPAAERMLGWTMEELEGRHTDDWLHGRRPGESRLPTAECPILQSRRDGVTIRLEEDAFARRDGTLLDVEYTVSPFETPQGVRGAVVVFSDITDRKAEQECMERDLEILDWLTRIRQALDEDRLVLHAQPIIDLRSGETVQHELLVRMLDEDGEPIRPGAFLPIAEQYGLIREIDRWVIGQAVRLAADGHPVELNLSAESLGDPELSSFVQRELTAHGADASLLVFELTETALIRDEERAREFIDRITALGGQFALDDFGTGYGGFTYLKRLPVDYLKIDIEFVRDLMQDPSCEHVVRAVVTLARAFGQRTVAEGVEDEATLRRLAELGVDHAQGYFIGRPAPVAEVMGARPAAL